MVANPGSFTQAHKTQILSRPSWQHGLIAYDNVMADGSIDRSPAVEITFKADLPELAATTHSLFQTAVRVHPSPNIRRLTIRPAVLDAAAGSAGMLRLRVNGLMKTSALISSLQMTRTLMEAAFPGPKAAAWKAACWAVDKSREPFRTQGETAYMADLQRQLAQCEYLTDAPLDMGELGPAIEAPGKLHFNRLQRKESIIEAATVVGTSVVGAVVGGAPLSIVTRGVQHFMHRAEVAEYLNPGVAGQSGLLDKALKTLFPADYVLTPGAARMLNSRDVFAGPADGGRLITTWTAPMELRQHQVPEG